MSDCLRYCRQPIGPVMAVAGDKANLPPVEPRQQAIPIEFYFTDPVRPVGRVFDQLAKLRCLVSGRCATNSTRRRRPVICSAASRCKRFMLKHRRTDALPGFLIMALDQEPSLLLSQISPVQTHEGKASVQPLTGQDKLKLAFAHPCVRIGDRLPSAAVPRLHLAAAILPGRDGAFEVGIIDGVVLDMDRHALICGIERRPLRHRPAPQHPAVFKPKVPVESRPVRCVLLHDEHRRASSGGWSRRRLWRDGKVALCPVSLDRGVAADNARFRHAG